MRNDLKELRRAAYEADLDELTKPRPKLTVNGVEIPEPKIVQPMTCTMQLFDKPKVQNRKLKQFNLYENLDRPIEDAEEVEDISDKVERAVKWLGIAGAAVLVVAVVTLLVLS